MADEFLGHTLEDWMPEGPSEGPPLPKWMNIRWPWYKAAAVTYTVNASVSGGHGSVAPATQTVNSGSSATISITPSTEYSIASITDNGSPVSIANPYVIPNITADHDVVITFSTAAAPPTTPVADIRVEKLTITPAEVTVGDTVTITVAATNYGGAAGTKIITCSVNGTNSQQTTTLAPSVSQILNFSATPNQAKTYQVSVDGLTGSFVAKPAVPKFIYASDIRRYTVTPPKNYYLALNIEVDIKNVGNAAGSVHPTALVWHTWGTIKDKVDMGTKTLAPGETATFTGTWYIHDSGWVPGPDDVWRLEYVLSEAGPISWLFGRSLYLVSIDIPAQIASGSEYWATQVIHLPYAVDSFFGVTLSLHPPAPLHSPDGYKGRDPWASYATLGTGYLTSTYDILLDSTRDYTIRGVYRQRGATEFTIIPGQSPARATFWAGFQNWEKEYPLPPGIYDVVSSVGYAKIAPVHDGIYGADNSAGPPWEGLVVGQVQII